MSTRITDSQPLFEWDQINKCKGQKFVLGTRKVSKVRQRFWTTKLGSKVEGCIVELEGGGEVGLTCMASEARRALNVITDKPEGSDPVRTN